jgi:hypothetical protein
VANIRDSELTHVKFSQHKLSAINEQNDNIVMFEVSFIARLIRALS